MENFVTDFRRALEIFQPNCTWTGYSLGSADPQVGPLATAFGQGTDMWVLSLSFGCLLPFYIDLPCQVGPLCKRDAGWDLLCISSASSTCFLLILDFNP
jgi:hypothetical protein